MRVALFLSFVFAAYGSIAAYRRPAEGYGFHPYGNNPAQQEAEAQARQLFWAIRDLLTVNLPRSTVRATFTSTVDMICTKSVARACRSSQVPFVRSPTSTENSERIEAGEEGDEQFPVAPTAVQQVEATALPTKQARAADPQYFVNPRAYENPLRNVQSAFYSGPYDPLPMPLYDTYPQPVAGQRQLFSGMLTATVTVSTALKINTITKTPRCSIAGPLPQCPNA